MRQRQETLYFGYKYRGLLEHTLTRAIARANKGAHTKCNEYNPPFSVLPPTRTLMGPIVPNFTFEMPVRGAQEKLSWGIKL